MAFKNLDYVVRDRVAEITLTRAPVNAIDHGLIEDLNNAYREAKADAGVRAVILTSAFDRAFSAGMDLAMIRGKRGLDLRRYLQKLYFEMHDLQYRMAKPTIAALTTYVPESQILFGTDFPYLTIGQNLDGLRKLGLSAAQLAAITRDNGVRLLPRLKG